MEKFGGYSFDEWAELAGVDPELFEQQRALAIEHLIWQAPEHIQKRLRGLQWQVETARAKATNPLASCIELNEMMWDFFYAERGFLNAINMNVEPLKELQEAERIARAAIPFRRTEQ